MGSWNKTCGLSSLHITGGTSVYVFVLEEDRDDSNCYSTSMFSPLLLPFESVYNDYGGGENSSGVALPLIMDGIKKVMIEMPLGENEYHDIEVTKEKFDEELFFDAVHEQRLKIQGHLKTDPVNIQFTMFRKDIMDAILEKHEIEEYVGSGKGTYAKWGDEKNYIRYNFSDIVADIRPMIEQAMAEINEIKGENGHLANYMMRNSIELLVDRDLNKAARWLEYDNYRYSRIVDINAMTWEALKAGTTEALAKLAEILEQHIKALFNARFMTDARRTWIPGGHEGSQSFSGPALRVLANATLEALDKEDAENS